MYYITDLIKWRSENDTGSLQNIEWLSPSLSLVTRRLSPNRIFEKSITTLALDYEANMICRDKMKNGHSSECCLV